jgi:hypothetical protein
MRPTAKTRPLLKTRKTLLSESQCFPVVQRFYEYGDGCYRGEIEMSRNYEPKPIEQDDTHLFLTKSTARPLWLWVSGSYEIPVADVTGIGSGRNLVCRILTHTIKLVWKSRNSHRSQSAFNKAPSASLNMEQIGSAPGLHD